jgi:hypothetical protein
VGTILGLKTNKIIAFIVGLLVLSGLTTAGIALAGGFSAQPAPSPAAQPATLPSELSAHFAALTEAPSAAVATFASADAEIKSRLEAVAEGAISSQYGLSASLAREVTYGSHHIWLIPGSTGIGFHDFGNGSGGGGPATDAVAGNIMLYVGGENGTTGGSLVYGLAPNGNSHVIVHDADGSTESVSVENNVYIITHPGAVSVEVTDGTGSVQTVSVPG